MSEAFKPLLERLARGEALTPEETTAFFAACLRGEPTPAQVGAALMAIRLKGESVEDIAAAASAMRAAARQLDHGFDVIDVCGTGGDGRHTLNISTAVALVLAGLGVKVAKHGNRAITSKSGTADVLAQLGLNLDATPQQQSAALDQANICFLFAQSHHSAMRHVSPIRQQLGFRTIFNLLGPLTNPAGAQRQLLGVPSPDLVEPLAGVLAKLGTVRAWVVHGQGLDELTTTGISAVCELKDGNLRRFEVDPAALGLLLAREADLVGGEPAFNAAALTRLLDGETGPYRDIVALNTAAALVVADRAETLEAGLLLAARSLDQGLGRHALATLIDICRPEATPA